MNNEAWENFPFPGKSKIRKKENPACHSEWFVSGSYTVFTEVESRLSGVVKFVLSEGRLARLFIFSREVQVLVFSPACVYLTFLFFFFLFQAT